MAADLQEIQVNFTAGPGKSESVGILARQGQRIFFEYSPSWLQRKLELSPFTLPAKPGLMEHKQREFGPLFGLFDDSLPDGWGLLLMDRHFRSMGLNPPDISPLDRLLYLGRCTMGALTYQPATEQDIPGNTVLDLHELALQSQQIFAGPMEYAYSLMAAAAGVEMPQTRLFTTAQGDSFFGVKRFDRGPGNRRYHIHTFGNMIQSNFRIPACDYGDLLKVTSILTRNHTDLLRAFRLMLFNVLAHNRDDHAKNFSFMQSDATGQWALSPAYD
ncbi:MAG: type II toxin-antitoxin system HipA family toxin, partial [Desulfopila sp.]